VSIRRQLNLRLDPKRLAHLDRMAAEANVKPGSLAKAMLEALIDDDAKAHETKKEAA
jgi:hypothetical protein